MMKRTFTSFEFDRNRLEPRLLFFSQNVLNCVHVVRETSNRQQLPTMTARHVMHTAIFNRRIIETNPTRQVRHRLRARPVRIILMPRDHAAMSGGLAKKLVMPESYGAAEQLRRRRQHRRVPQQIVEARHNPPSSECVKQNGRPVS